MQLFRLFFTIFIKVFSLFKTCVRTKSPREKSTIFHEGLFWSRRRGSNPRPQRPERCALPAALRLDCLLIFSTNAFIISNAISNVNLFSRTIITIFQSRRVFSIFSKFSLRTLLPIYPPRISPHSPYYTSTFG